MPKTATPSGVSGICKLCLQDAPLCDSHMLPAALYRLLRSQTIKPSDPLLITDKVTLTSSRQPSAYLLCVQCEDRFRTGGEEWMMQRCYRGGAKFLLRDSVLGSQLLDDGEMGRLYSVKESQDVSVEHLAFFAASVFWRASIHNWRFGPRIERIFLGPYQESLRRYLLGQEPFPLNAAIWVWVSNYDKPSRAISFPHSLRTWDCYAHVFDIPGVRFTMLVGKVLPEIGHRLCILQGSEKIILVSSAPDDILASDVGKMSQTTRVSPRLLALGKWSWTH
jgi:hypothetical protein